MTKKELRKLFEARRQTLTTAEVADGSRAIAQLFFSFFAVENIRAVHCYLPIRRKNEVDTFPIIYTIQEKFLKTQIVISRSLPETTELEHYQWLPDMTLAMNKWGILEPNPLSAIRYHLSEIEIIIIPLLAYDKQGNRVGYGKGFYDRFLAKCPTTVIKVGLSFFDPVERVSDIDTFDIRLDYCITPTRVWKMFPSK